ncbi:MAG TPA: Gfo/Idh/MocA family oxidoreductase [Sedimentisphaerales bacterium]|nr:Gfo/Idh/MocA family oxidoreductase [Sedimentisphaerales bacterium]
MVKKANLNRREFLKGTAVAVGSAAGLPYFVPASALGKGGNVAASERITLGFIGLGIRGGSHVRTFLGYKETQVAAVCDVDRSRREATKKLIEEYYGRQTSGTYKGCDTYSDFREMLGRKDIDAVVIATPEHWHSLTMIAAAKAGKDVYGEKALTLTVPEGRVLCETVRRYGCVFQVGTQQRSSRNFRFACELARNGYLGKLQRVKVGVPGGHALPDAPTIPVPEGLDYDMWLGPAPLAPYNAVRCTSPEGWYHIYDYCAGWIQSWGVHHIDIALWGAPSLLKSPLEVEGMAVFPTEGLGNTSLTWRVEFVTGDGLRLSFSDNGYHKAGCRFEGEKGWVHVNRKDISAGPESLLNVKLGPREEHLYESSNHHANFLECVRSRRETAAPVEAGHAATTVTLIADVATRLRRKVTWDWKSERFVNDQEANRMLKRPMRSPWRL